MTVFQSKRRARRRAKSAGAIIFIVAMTLAVLATLGLYALSAASSELKTAGYERQFAQDQYLAEFALVATAQRIDTAAAVRYYGQMMDPTGATSQFNTAKPRNGCYALVGATASSPQAAKACRRIQKFEFEDAYGAIPAVRPNSLATSGSLGRVALDGDFDVELTDPAAVPSPGGGGGFCDLRFTVTAAGRTLGQGGTYATYGGEGLLLARAQVLVPNAPCPAN